MERGYFFWDRISYTPHAARDGNATASKTSLRLLCKAAQAALVAARPFGAVFTASPPPTQQAAASAAASRPAWRAPPAWPAQTRARYPTEQAASPGSGKTPQSQTGQVPGHATRQAPRLLLAAGRRRLPGCWRKEETAQAARSGAGQARARWQ